MMNETNDWLEIMIGKLVDGEMTPPERKILERELETNSQAKELLEQLRGLRQRSCEAVAAEVSGGASADQIFERAWKQNSRSGYGRIFRIGGGMRFAIGLAAGLIFGLSLHFMPIWGSKAPVQGPGLDTREVAQGGNMPAPADNREVPVVRTGSQGGTRPRTGEVDWYVFTGPGGEKWLVEGVREGKAQTAAYRGKPRAM